jgi:hypothetical protein
MAVSPFADDGDHGLLEDDLATAGTGHLHAGVMSSHGDRS